MPANRLPRIGFSLVLMLAMLLPMGSLCAREEILAFQSRIEVRPDGSLVVEETIRVRAEGHQIKRGIYRDFPTLYRGKFGFRMRVPFRVESVTRDGKREPWRREARGNGVRIYFGSPDVFLPPGETTYSFRYSTSRQLGFFEDYDELYWNVTGSDWAFPILEASACVKLPPGARASSIEAYTGAPGSREAAYEVRPRPGCDAFVAAARPLSPGEGFTIVVTWPKGFVSPPGSPAIFFDDLLANQGVAAGLVGLLVALAYFLAVWWMHGRDPERGVIIPLYSPPQGLTPEDVRYLHRLGAVDDRSFAAAILNLAVQGVLKISQGSAGTYTLSAGDAKASDPMEQKLANLLFDGRSALPISQKHYKVFQEAKQELAKALKEKHRGAYKSNLRFWMVGLGLALIPVAISLFDAREPGGAIFLLVWLSLWSFGCATLAVAVGAAWRSGTKLKAIPITLFSLPFFGGWIMGFLSLLHAASLWVAVVFVLAVLLCMIFLALLPQPTVETQKLRDHILGFRKYLVVGEAERLGLEVPPDRTPELFEKFLPYALALGVEQQWAKNFSDVLEAAGYQPRWLSDRSLYRTFSAGALATAVGSSLAGAISSSSLAPGSRSGRGGGSSGGGGGGGGGGGW